MYLEENFWSGPGDPRQQNRQADRARMTQIANFHDSSLNEVTYGRLTSAFQRRRKSRTRSVPLTVPCLCQGSLRPTHQSRPGTVRPRCMPWFDRVAGLLIQRQPLLLCRLSRCSSSPEASKTSQTRAVPETDRTVPRPTRYPTRDQVCWSDCSQRRVGVTGKSAVGVRRLLFAVQPSDWYRFS